MGGRRVFEIGQRLLDRYEVFARYTGGMATVYGAIDVEDGRRYAIKTARTTADQPALDAAFRREIAIGLALGRHPGILRLRFAEALGDQRFAFFDFIDGGEVGRTLRDHIDARAITTALFGDYAQQIARALAFLGSQRPIAHLDLKPSNILVDPTGRILISDFGVSHAVGGFDIQPSMASGGTVGYMAPEHRGQQVVDERSDIYAFGVVLYEMLTGVPPETSGRDLYHRGLHRAGMIDPFCTELGDADCERIGRLIGGCIDTRMSDRFGTFAEVVRAVASIFDPLPEPAIDEEDAAAGLRRARSWQVIGEHSQCLRALNRLLVAHPACAGAFEAAGASFAALAAQSHVAAMSPQIAARAEQPCVLPGTDRELFDLLTRCID
jgi:serine/threonine protein kinase